MTCSECSREAVGTCYACGKPKCSGHMNQQEALRNTGLSVGPFPIRETVRVSAGHCIACWEETWKGPDRLKSATTPAEVLLAVSGGVSGLVPELWWQELRNKWREMATRGDLGEPTHELQHLEPMFGGGFHEPYRRAAWRVERVVVDSTNSGATKFDAWVSIEGEVFWPLSRPTKDGKIVPPHEIVTSVGASVRTRKQWIRGGVPARLYREERLVEGFSVVNQAHCPDKRQCSLYSAMVPFLERRLHRPT